MRSQRCPARCALRPLGHPAATPLPVAPPYFRFDVYFGSEMCTRLRLKCFLFDHCLVRHIDTMSFALGYLGDLELFRGVYDDLLAALCRGGDAFDELIDQRIIWGAVGLLWLAPPCCTFSGL